MAFSTHLLPSPTAFLDFAKTILAVGACRDVVCFLDSV